MSTPRFLAAAALVALAGGGFLGWRWLEERADRETLRAAERAPFADAEPRLRRLAERRPDDAAAARALALGYLEANRLGDAETYFARWCALRPDDAEPFRRRVDLWKARKRWPDAADDALAAFRLGLDDPPLRQELARWLFLLGRFDEAERECRLCLEEVPGHPVVLQLLAALHHQLGRAAEATAIVDRLTRDFPTYADAYVLRGALYLRADRPADAVTVLRKALAIDGPHRRAALYELSLALARTGQADEARTALAESRLLQEVELYNAQNVRNSVDQELRFAELLLAAKRLPEALRMLNRLAQQHPDHPEVRRLLAAARAAATPAANSKEAKGTP